MNLINIDKIYLTYFSGMLGIKPKAASVQTGVLYCPPHKVHLRNLETGSRLTDSTLSYFWQAKNGTASTRFVCQQGNAKPLDSLARIK